MGRLFQRTIIVFVCLLVTASSSAQIARAADNDRPLPDKKPQGGAGSDGRELPAGAVACMRSDQAGPVFAIAIAPDGSTLASAGHDGAIRFWSLKTGKELRTIPDHPGKVRSIAFSPNGKVLATASSEKTVRLWDAGSGKLLRELSGGLENVMSVAFSPDGRNLACGSGWGKGSILIWDLARGAVLQTLALGRKAKEAWNVVRAISYSPDGKHLAAAAERLFISGGDDDGMVSLFEVETGQEQLRYLGHQKGTFSVAFAPDGKALMTAGGDKAIRLWDASTGKVLREFKGHEDWVTTATFSPNGRTIASVSYDKTVRIWDVATGKEIRQFIGHTDRIRCAAFAPDGKTLATGGVDSAVFIWDVADVCASADARINVGPNVQVSKSRENIAHREVVIAADPKDRARLLAGSMVLPPKDGDNKDDLSVVAYRSCDSGKTWELAFQKKTTKGELRFADPAVAFGPDGSAYFAAIGGTPVQGKKMYLEISSSRDGGKTWQEMIIERERMPDRPFLAVDSSSEKFRGRLYCNCHLFEFEKGPLPAVFTSRDGGKTFDPPKLLQMTAARGGTIPGQGVVLSDGTLVFAYRTFVRDTDATGRVSYSRFGIRIRRSTTGGETFLEERSVHVADFLAGGDPIMPMLAADTGSKAFKDRLHLVWPQMTDAGQRVMFSQSNDKGESWSRPVVISDEANSEDSGVAKTHHASLPSVTVNKDGIVGVTYYDFRNGREGKFRCNVRFLASLDGGATWLPSMPVTDVASEFDFHGKWKGGSLGDTAGLAADAAGDFHPLWVDNRTGVLQVFTAKVAVCKNEAQTSGK